MKDNDTISGLNTTAILPAEIVKLRKNEQLFIYLNRAAQDLARTRDTGSALKKIAQLIVPKFATWFSIDLLKADHMEELILAHEDPEMIRWARKYREAYPTDLQSDSGAAKVVKTGLPSFFPVITKEMVLASIKDPEQLEAVLKMNLQSVITVALFERDVIKGAITFVSSATGRFYDDSDLLFAQNLANHIGLALENARLNEQLQAGERKLEQILTELPAKVVFFRGADLIVETINEATLLAWNKKRSEALGKPLLEILPELKGQPFPRQLKQVFETGVVITEKEIVARLNLPGGGVKTFYNDYFYQPLTDREGTRIGVLATSFDVTDKVSNRLQLEQAYEQARLSKEAAQLGTFDMDLEKGIMEWDERCRMLFGISHQEKVSYENDFVGGLHPDDRDRILHVITDEVMVQSVSNGKYDVEYRTIGAEDQQLRWVRAKGQVYFDPNGVPRRFIGSVLDITEQKQDEQRKNDFIGMVSHELKTPLTSLTAIVQVMNAKLKNSPDSFLSGAAEKANHQVKKMSSMINGFLNVSRLESGKIVLNKQYFELNELIHECIDEAQLSFPAHTITLDPCAAVSVFADRDKIGSVLSNILSNAVKYAPKRELIEVKCAIAGHMATVSVKDEGIGIKPAELDKLFDRYYRIESSHTRHISGFGIGLYLSAEIIRRHDGKIWAESELGKGSTFYFSLPLAG